MSDSDSQSTLDRLRGLVSRWFLFSVPDHPANGGMTGDRNDWDRNASEDEETEQSDADR